MQVPIGRQANGHARAGGDQGHVFQGGPKRFQIFIAGGVDNGHTHPIGLELFDFLADGGTAFGHDGVIDQAHFALGLSLHHANQVGICHGGERMVLHAAFIQEHGPCKQIAFEHRSAVVWECGCGNGEWAIKRIHQGISDRADVARRRAVKR